MARKFSKEDLEKLGIKQKPKTLEEIRQWEKDMIKENPQNQENTVAKIIVFLIMIGIVFLIYWLIFS
tara:strand:+ start:702 stop:902 length:201 start_codon:yes stop_codon:yes gene_type:complete